MSKPICTQSQKKQSTSLPHQHWSLSSWISVSQFPLSFLSPLVRVCYGPSLYWWCQSTEQTPSTHTNYKNHPNISILNPLWPGTLEKQSKVYVHGALCYLSLKCSGATGVKVPSVLWCCWLGGRKACKNWVVGCWHGYLSGASCRLAYAPADATATHCLLLQ